jgi:ABC-type transport system substrate-binding protein
MLTENNPNRRMVLERNPNFRGEAYPSEGNPGDLESGLLEDAGKIMPFIDKAVYSLEPEIIPYWSKFLQGYYDTSSISSDSFDQAISIDAQGRPDVSQELERKGLQLIMAVRPSIWFMGFNMRDEVIGGASERARKLRRAISIAVDYEEFISIFANGRGVPAQGPIPPGIFGYQEGQAGVNPYVYHWVNNALARRPIEEARTLVAEAGYPGGRDANTGQALTLHFDTALTGPEAKARLDWLRKQFNKLGIQLDIRASDFNRFQDKVRKGAAQIFEWGWNADYPDPENFLFLLYGPNATVDTQGENHVNYRNPEFDALFQRVKSMDNGPERQALIDQMVEILRQDAPWVWGWHDVRYVLYHGWYGNAIPNLMADNTLKYKKVDPGLRTLSRAKWNRPVRWPLVILGLVFFISLLPAYFIYRRKERAVALR